MFWKKFVELCMEKGKYPNAVAAELGFSNSVTTSWKHGAIPRESSLRKIADYFDVPFDYFSAGTNCNNEFWDKFESLCKEHGKSPNAVAADIGIKSSGTITGWKNGALPRPGVVKKLSDYFGVPIEFLSGDTNDEKSPQPKQARGSIEKQIVLDYLENASQSDLATLAKITLALKER